MPEELECTQPHEKGFCSQCGNQYLNFKDFPTWLCLTCWKKGFRVKMKNGKPELELPVTAEIKEVIVCHFRKELRKGSYQCTTETRYVVYCAYTNHAIKEITECFEVHKKTQR